MAASAARSYLESRVVVTWRPPEKVRFAPKRPWSTRLTFAVK
jgi:hypothetical protein